MYSVEELLDKYKKHNRKWVFFSGGKDSLVALDLVSKYWKDFDVIYIEVTGNTHPKCTKYVRRVVEDYYGKDLVILRKNTDFYECLKECGYPSLIFSKSRWCLNKFKRDVVEEYTKGEGVGVAGLYPNSTRRRGRINLVFTAGWTKITISPIYKFNEKTIWRYIRDNNLIVNPLYNVIGYSGNCMFCPFMSKRNFYSFAKTNFFCKLLKAHKNMRKMGMRAVYYDIDNKIRQIVNQYRLSDFSGKKK